jgi:hypothetical protein
MVQSAVVQSAVRIMKQPFHSNHVPPPAAPSGMAGGAGRYTRR